MSVLSRRRLLAQLGLALSAPGLAAARSQPTREDRSIEGHWACRTWTNLERPKELTGLWASKSEADEFLKKRSTPPPPEHDPVGQATTEWIEVGGLVEVAGRYMTSWIVDPPDGRLPYSEAGRARLKALEKQFDEDMDNPEARDAAERCLGGSVGPPVINVGYGGHLRILRTTDHVAIQTEEGFAPRIIRLGRVAEPQLPHSWTGVSRAWFEGPDLYVETTSFHPAYLLHDNGFYLSPEGKVTERFTRSAKDELRYAFTVEDPAIFTQTWHGLMIFKASDARVFEFACHEGNYGLANILAGARETEKANAMKAPTVASQR